MIARARTDQMVQEQRRAQPGLAVFLRGRNDGAADRVIVDAMDLLLLPRRQDERLPGIWTVRDTQELLDEGDDLAALRALVLELIDNS